jgi:hypothetical protein
MPVIKLSDIDTESSVQVRAKLDHDTVAEYAAHIEAKKVPLPPIIVFGPDSRGKFFLSEGWHRVEAAKRAGREGLMATIKDGGWKEALEHALGSNAAHGLKRSNPDKRRAVELALKHWPGWSSVAIAEKCGVSQPFALSVKGEHPITVIPPTGETTAPEMVIGRNGKQYPAHPPSRQPSAPPPAPQGFTPMERAPVEPHIPIPPPPDPEDPEPMPPYEEGDLPKDAKGRPIPPHCVPIWERRQEVVAVLKSVSEIRLSFIAAQEDRDPLWNGDGKQGQTLVNFSSVIAHLNQVYADIKAALAIRVCPVCQGCGCKNCSGNGVISAYRLTNVPSEYR